MEKKSPHDLLLEKSSSGSWALPGSPKRTCKPWQRLWLVSGIIYLLMLAGSFYIIIPDKESIEQRMVFSITEEVKRYDGMAFAGEAPRVIFDIARTQGYASWIKSTRSKYRIGAEGDAGFARIEKNYLKDVADLPIKRAIGILICIIAWIVPMALFYAMGFVVDWIKSGIEGRD